MASDLIVRLKECVLENISNENFGVSELSESIGMSRSNLLRRIKTETGLSASQFIRQIRLEEAMFLLKEKKHNVSEVAHLVGFGSNSYFIKCFREYYGYPPGEVGKRPVSGPVAKHAHKTNRLWLIVGGVFVLILIVSGFWMFQPEKDVEIEKSIAILPFKNDSNDSTNIYLINGLMESTLNNLQKIKELRVVSRTSVEKYRGSTKTIPEIARELPVSYFVEGSGQKVDDRIQLNIQLIEAATDRHVWSKQYHRQVTDIFELQQEIAKNIVREIQVAITPEEEERIDRIPTKNLEAYDVYLKGVECLNRQENPGLKEAIGYFEQAILLDPSFGVAYAHMAIAYYYMDMFRADKQYLDKINTNADKALLYDPKALLSLIAKSCYFLQAKEYELAIPYLERAYEFYPNSADIINMLSNFYTNFIPNTAKYLEYALKGIQIEIGTTDSVTTSYLYLHLSNALIQNGFVKEANKYIDISLDYNPDNYYSSYVKAFITYAQHGDLRKTEKELLVELAKDTTRVDITQEIAKINFYLGDYKRAFKYYQRFLKLKEQFGLDVFVYENLRIAMTFEEVGLMKEAKPFVASFKEFADNDHSIYKHLSLMAYYSYIGDQDRAIEHLRKFTKEDNYHYWVVLFMEDDPECHQLAKNPEARKLFDLIYDKFWREHESLKVTLKEQGLI